MTRSLSTANEAASQAAVIAPVGFVKLEFDSGPVCFHTHLGPITWGGDTYTGAGDLGTIAPVEEDTELARSTLNLTLSGLNAAIVSIALAEHYQGRPASLYLGYLDPATMQLVDTPTLLYKGRMDTASITRNNGEVSVTLSVESRFAAWDRPRVRRYNNADQQARYPGDRGLEFVEQATERRIVWGQKN
jgi:hypothetical protein